MILLLYLFPLFGLIYIYKSSEKKRKVFEFDIATSKNDITKDIVIDKKVKLAVNIIYFLGIFTIFALMVYAEYCAWSWARGGWNGPHMAFPPLLFVHHFFYLEPFNAYVAYAIAVGTLPMGIATHFFVKFNSTLKSKFSSIKRVLAWMPASFCLFMIGHIIFRILITRAFANF